MLRVKIAVVALVLGVIALACSAGKSQPYSIQDSKAYEASLFRQNCAVCHGPEAEGKTTDTGLVVPSLRHGPYKYKTENEIYDHIAKGGNGMVPFAGQLSDREIRMMTGFVMNELREKEK